jgi:5'-methylthioadenosine phosphorylase
MIGDIGGSDGGGFAMTKAVLGIIGGSGLYDLPGLENKRSEAMATPWGEPSGPLSYGEIGGLPIVFLPRHGAGHRIPPSAINYRANIDALKRAGVTDLVSVSACGSFREEAPPGTFVLVDQFIDRTFAREKSFFGQGLVAHVSMAHPVCPRLSGLAAQAARAAGADIVEGGTYLVMEGPQFSTKAESELYRQWGCHVIGMTNMPEAKLAREAELPYASIAMVTDYDCWHPDHDHVDVAQIIACLLGNAERAKGLIQHLAGLLKGKRTPSPIDTALDNALITAPHARDPAVMQKLQVVAGRALAR